MSARDSDEPNRTSSPLELLFDLTFVVAIAQFADELSKQIIAGHGLRGSCPRDGVLCHLLGVAQLHLVRERLGLG
jgi:hypothetical protein